MSCAHTFGCRLGILARISHDADLAAHLIVHLCYSPRTCYQAGMSQPILCSSACTEPMVEAWSLALEARGGSAGRALSLTSKEYLNLTLTPNAFRSIGDAKAFFEALTKPHALDSTPDRPSAAARLIARSVAQWQAATRGRMATLYRWPRHNCVHAGTCCKSFVTCLACTYVILCIW